jgi:hypothetical protein
MPTLLKTVQNGQNCPKWREIAPACTYVKFIRQIPTI